MFDDNVNVYINSKNTCCVIYCHSKVFMVQATRLCNLICVSVIRAVCSVVHERVCVCVCVFIYIYILFFYFFGDLMITYI